MAILSVSGKLLVGKRVASTGVVVKTVQGSKKQKPTVVVYVELPVELAAAITRYKQVHGTSKRWIVTQALERYLSEKSQR